MLLLTKFPYHFHVIYSFIFDHDILTQSIIFILIIIVLTTIKNCLVFVFRGIYMYFKKSYKSGKKQISDNEANPTDSFEIFSINPGVRLLVLWLTVLISLYLFYLAFVVDKNNFDIVGTIYIFKHDLFNFNICYDGISILFWILTSILIVLCVLVNWTWSIK